MVLIVAALAEEAKIALESSKQARHIGTVAGLLEARRNGMRFLLLKSGVGPEAAANRLTAALERIQPQLILVIGYAGALEAGLELGDLVVINRSSLLGKLHPEVLDTGSATCEGTWDLPSSSCLARIAASAGLPIRRRPGLTSHDVIGDPLHKERLHKLLGAGVIDMETAALARVARSKKVPVACVRAITDTVDDEFLRPFSFQSRAKRISTHVTSFARGEFFQNSQEWSRRSRIASESLRRFLDVYFEVTAGEKPDPSQPGS